MDEMWGLATEPAERRSDLLADPVAGAVRTWQGCPLIAVARTAMEYGGITPFGLPADWPVLVDDAVVAEPYVVAGSGLRRSKLVVPGPALGQLPAATVIPGLAR